MASFPTRAAAGLAVMVDWAAQRGITPEQCLAGTRLTTGSINVPNAEVTGQQELRAITNVVNALGEQPGLGLEIAPSYPITAYGVWGFALISSRTLREAIEVGLGFIRLTYAFCTFEAKESDDGLELSVDASSIPPTVRRFVLERDAAAIPTLSREILGMTPPPKRVTFALPDPGPVANRYAQMFGAMPDFNSPITRITLAAEDLDRPLPQASPQTAALAVASCRALLQRREARAGLSGQVRDLLLIDPSRQPSLVQLADSLSTSTRTLRRHLQSEGTSVRDLQNEVRKHLATELLRSGLSVERVSGRLGYTDVSNFSHAFSRWHGVGPRDYLARQRNRPGRS